MGFFDATRWLGQASNRRKTKVLRETASKDPQFFYQEWTRRAVPQTGGQNYQLSSHQLPRYSLSGPLAYIATPFHPGEPTRAQGQRQYPNASVGGAGIANGTLRTQSLYNPDAGGFTRSPFPVIASPFHPFGITPAGAT